MRGPWPTRRFDGKTYELDSTEPTKYEAQRLAKRYRKQGFNVRITHGEVPEGWGIGKAYILWVRAQG